LRSQPKERKKVMKIVINTPAGNIGRVVVDQLLRAKENVVIISRHPKKVADLVKRGAHLEEGSIDDPRVLDHALKGADALFWLTPFAYDQPDYIKWARRTGQTAASAVKRHGVKRIVLISSVGAQHGSGVGPIACLPAIETSFKEAAPDVTSLRAGSFMENFLNNVGMIAGTGTIFGPHLAGQKLPMVATRDIGEKVVEVLRDARWKGFRIVGVHGPEDLDQSRAAQIISEGIGRPVKYVEVTVDQAKKGMLAAGLPGFMVELLGEMYTGFREGRMDRAEPRSSETTTKTSLLEFSRQVLKPAVDAALRS
jgi:uncharacterized protein YbjT (DUF2867 family)